MVFILGILTTVITAVTLTRMMIALWYKTFSRSPAVLILEEVAPRAGSMSRCR